MMVDINTLLQKAVVAGASDIHLKINNAPVFRIHGTLSAITDGNILDVHDMQNIVTDITPNHLLDNLHKEHEADFSIEEEGIGRFRVNIFYAQGVPAIVMRHVKSDIPSFEKLHLPESFNEFADYQRGIIIVSGTTGSGKSSTLAAIIGTINKNHHKRILTLEDPVEYHFKDDKSFISQREIGLDSLDYQSALKHVLRQDPDIIMIGEMRDQLSIRTALLAAETGHLVLSTLHASGSAIAIRRILDVFPANEQEHIRMTLAFTPLVIISQRLIPSIDGTVRPAIEILKSTPTIQKMLKRNELDLLYAVMETGEDEGMTTFNKSLYNLIKSGQISETAGLSHATNPESLKMNLKGIFLDEGNRIIGK